MRKTTVMLIATLALARASLAQTPPPSQPAAAAGAST
jgi:hypothetical protein